MERGRKEEGREEWRGKERRRKEEGRMERKERERSVHIPPLGFLLGNFFLFLSFFPVQGSRFSSIQP